MFLEKLKVELPPSDAEIPHRGGSQPKAIEVTLSERHLHPTFMAALFTISQLWTQPRCSSTNERITPYHSVVNTEYYSVVTR